MLLERPESWLRTAFEPGDVAREDKGDIPRTSLLLLIVVINPTELQKPNSILPSVRGVFSLTTVLVFDLEGAVLNVEVFFETFGEIV